MSCGWFYNDVSGVVRHDCGIAYVADLLAVMIGTWHGPYQTKELADAHAGVTGANAFNPTSLPQAIAGTTTGALIPDLFTQRSFAVRLVEAILGIILVGVGVKALL